MASPMGFYLNICAVQPKRTHHQMRSPLKSNKGKCLYLISVVLIRLKYHFKIFGTFKINVNMFVENDDFKYTLFESVDKLPILLVYTI